MKSRRGVVRLLVALVIVSRCVSGSADGAQETLKVQAQDTADRSLEALLAIKTDVSSTKGETLLESSSVVTVIDRAMIEQFSFRDLTEVLQIVAGVSVGRSYMLQGMLTSRGVLQDLYANKNLLLMDGVPTWHAVTGENRLERISINDVERIEIVRGPASVLHGSQAFTSAINIVTRATEQGTHAMDSYATTGIGGLSGVGGNYRAHTRSGLQFSLGVNLNHGQRIDYDFLDENGTQGNVRDYSDAGSVTAKLRYAGHTVFMNAYDVELGSFGSNPSFAGGAGTPHQGNGVLAAYQFDRTFTSRLQLRTRAFYDSSYREFQRDATNTVYSPIRGYRTGGNALLGYGLAENLDVVVGADFGYRYADEATSRNRASGALVDGFVDQGIHDSSMFAQLDWKPGAWRAVGGARFTENSLFGHHVALRGTVGYQLSSRQAVKLVTGQSYRSPSLAELFTATPNITGNPSIRPETSESVDFVYQHTAGGVHLQAVGYWARYNSKIYRERGTPPAGVPNPTAPAYYTNGHIFDAVGLELEAKHMSETWGTHFINVDYVAGSSADLVVEQPGGYRNYNFRYVPHYNLSAGAFKQYRQTGASAVVTHTPSTDGPFGVVGRWTDVSLNVFVEQRWKDATVRHTLAGRNVLDSSIAFPEFTRRKAYVNEVPFSAEPGLSYVFSVRF